MSEEESSIQENFMTHKNSGDSVQRKIVRQVPDVLRSTKVQGKYGRRKCG